MWLFDWQNVIWALVDVKTVKQWERNKDNVPVGHQSKDTCVFVLKICSFLVLKLPVTRSYSNSDPVFQVLTLCILSLFPMWASILQKHLVFHTATLSVWTPHCIDMSPGNWRTPWQTNPTFHCVFGINYIKSYSELKNNASAFLSCALDTDENTCSKHMFPKLTS